MSKRTLGPDGLDELCTHYRFASERMQISREWYNITGTDLPDRIAYLPISEQRAALEFQRQKYRPVMETSGNDDHRDFNTKNNRADNLRYLPVSVNRGSKKRGGGNGK